MAIPAFPPVRVAIARQFSNTSVKQAVKEVTSTEQFKSLIGGEKVTVVDFYATWCGPCKAIEPIIEKISDLVPQAEFLRVDVDQQTEIAKENKVTAMPTIKFFKESQHMGTIIGADVKKIIDKVQELTGVDVRKSN
jgi:thioredoxin 1